MAIQATCPNCESTIRASDKYAGLRVKCPKCGGSMRVPQKEGEPDSATTETAASVAPSTANSDSIDPGAARSSAPAPALSSEPPQAVEAAHEEPLVRIDDDGERWRRAVAKKKPSKPAKSGSPTWIWPAVGLGACALVAAGVAYSMRQPDKEELVASHDPAAIAIAQNDNDANPAVPRPTETQSLNPVTNLTPATMPEEVEPAASGENADDEGITSRSEPSTDDAAAMASAATTMRESDQSEEPLESDAPDTNDVASSDAAPATPDASNPVVLDQPPEEVLKEHGIRIVGDQAALIDESTGELRGALREAQKLKASLARTFTETMKLEKLQKNLKAEYGLRSAALAQVNATRPNDTTSNNVLVGQLAAIRTQVDQLDETIETSRKKLAEAREDYIEHLLKTRATIDAVQKEYETASADPEVQAALAMLSKDQETELMLEPLGSFYRSQQDLEKLEEQVLSDTIVARVESGNLFVSTMINGEHTIEMIVDSGASVVTLPYDMAVEAGLKPKDSDPVAQFQIADGSLISGKMITIPSFRVGKFTVENVEAAVLEPSAVGATPLLGMSFLGKFETKIDPERGHLILSRIEGAEDSDQIRE